MIFSPRFKWGDKGVVGSIAFGDVFKRSTPGVQPNEWLAAEVGFWESLEGPVRSLRKRAAQLAGANVSASVVSMPSLAFLKLMRELGPITSAVTEDPLPSERETLLAGGMPLLGFPSPLDRFYAETEYGPELDRWASFVARICHWRAGRKKAHEAAQ